MNVLEALRTRWKQEHVRLDLDRIQALILRARPEPYVGLHAVLRVDDAVGGRAFVRDVTQHITSAADWTADLDSYVGIAFSHAGLVALGLPQSSLDSFPLPFRQGMAARAGELRDAGENAPATWEPVFQDGSCHIAVTIYAVDAAALEEAERGALDLVHGAAGITVVELQRFGAEVDGKNPFGFRDSIGQPMVDGSGVASPDGGERAIAAGEVVLGEDSENGEPLAMPAPDVLGRNGSFAVLRKYESRVGGFNDFVRHAAAAEDGDEELLAAKLFGRWRSGAPLVLSPDHDDEALGGDAHRNDAFAYSDDADGLRCPFSSHMRRLNPRDSTLSILTDVRIHRIIRRVSTYGPRWDPSLTAADDERRDRGVFFIFISARAYDTIEFMQQEWIDGGNFIDLGEEQDPIVARHDANHAFTVPAEPIRKRLDGISAFNRLRGGEYLFLPSTTALAWIGAGSWS